ncbi:MAG: phospholipase D-like domain-containing protein [Candidatus Absconditabacteria bacterium]|nr:phospholipase D-like domain-containing protein [Candidatus Absconditabacteria bacterium]
MKKKLKYLRVLLIIPLGVLLFQIERGEGYTSQVQEEVFIAEDFFTSLQSISGEVLIGPDEEVQRRYLDSVAQTRDTLKIQTYEFTHQLFKELFSRLAGSGTQVQIIIEDQKYQQFQNTLKQLQDFFSGLQNIEIKSDQQMGTTYVHSKITLLDNAFWIQSANLTKSSFESNREHFFYSEDEEVFRSLQQIFEKDWEGVTLMIGDLHSNLVVCPVNCRGGIEALLSGAQESIIIQTQYIMDEEILKILRKKSEEINLKIIVADTIDNANLTNYFGPGVARALKAHYNHTKMILVDEKYLLLGSMNLSDNSLDNNREIGIILLEEKQIQTFLSGFWADWRNS